VASDAPALRFSASAALSRFAPYSSAWVCTKLECAVVRPSTISSSSASLLSLRLSRRGAGGGLLCAQFSRLLVAGGPGSTPLALPPCLHTCGKVTPSMPAPRLRWKSIEPSRVDSPRSVDAVGTASCQADGRERAPGGSEGSPVASTGCGGGASRRRGKKAIIFRAPSSATVLFGGIVRRQSCPSSWGTPQSQMLSNHNLPGRRGPI
jgi:hypothetical protein